MTDIYMIPKTIPCEKCEVHVDTAFVLLHGTCPRCGAVQHKENYGKYLGVIKDVKE